MIGCCCVEDDDFQVVIIDVKSEGREQFAGKLIEEKAQAEPKAREEPKPEKKRDPLKDEPKEEDSGPQPYIFEVAVERDGEHLGMVLDTSASTKVLFVSRIVGGSLTTYNDAVEDDRRIKMYDFILEINGRTTHKEMLEDVKNCKGYAKLKILRPVPFSLLISRSTDKELGAGICYHPQVPSLGVKEIREGLLKDYNDTVPEDKQVKAGDCIIAVNGVSTDTMKMVEAMKATTDLTLTIIRPPDVW
mmetsp:Transcript_73340/g.238676  ORF Transcript_73340/g.238676 Transcript_73340/m.238676 type:complete len:246 (+) Transcript_73340:49-786(+)